MDTTFTEIDADGDGQVDLQELKNYLGDFMNTLLKVFNDALLEYPEKMIRVDAYSVSELEVIRD